jgi:hypothetical protein
MGYWIRYTMRADDGGGGESALWLMTMDPSANGAGGLVGRKASLPLTEITAEAEPFRLRIGEAELTDGGMRGGFEDVSWDLTWAPGQGYQHVHPLLQRSGLAKTVLTLPHANVRVSGSIDDGRRAVTVADAPGGQAHLWGSKHAKQWAWVHCNDFTGLDGSPRPDDFVDSASVVVERFGRDFGPNTPVVGRFGGVDFASTSPLRVVANPSSFALTGWTFEAKDGARKITAQVDAGRDQLVGVTYHDPDGAPAYCYNSEIANMRVTVWEGERVVDELVARGTAHFEYAQREPVPGLALQVQ